MYTFSDKGGATVEDKQKFSVALDDIEFTKFARFDAWIHQRKLIAAVVFVAIFGLLGIFATVSAIQTQDSLIFAAVLFFVMLTIPFVYVVTFEASIKKECNRFQLAQPKFAYDLAFTSDSITIAASNNSHMTFKWSQVDSVWKRKDVTYIYIATKAYIIPNASGDTETLWNLFRAKLASHQCHQ